MSGNFKCLGVGFSFSTYELPNQSDIVPWRRQWGYKTKENLARNDTCIIIFGPSQDKQLEAFLKDDLYKILYKSKKCVNPNYKNTGGRNTVVIFEEKK